MQPVPMPTSSRTPSSQPQGLGVPAPSRAAKWQRLRDILMIVLAPVHLRRTAMVAAVVGSWLTAFNHGDELLRGDFGMRLAAKIALDYLTPFVVSNVGLLARQRH